MALKRMRAVDKTASIAFANFKPPENLTVSQWAARYRVLSRESSAEAGPWRNERTPYMVEPMDAYTDPKVRRITVVASSQVGKSEFILNCLGYSIDQDPASLLYIQPNIEDAKKFSKRRIAPMIRDCPRLRDKVAAAKGRDSSNTVQEKSFPGGALSIVGSNSPSALASTPVRCVFGDERDRWALSAGTEGDPWELARKRTTTYYNAKLVEVSTCTIKGASPIAEAYDEGTRERWCHQCPHCGEWHEIDFDDIKFDFDTIKTGRKTDYKVKSVNWCCPSCGCLSSEAEIRRQPQKWVMENPAALELPTGGHRSFWLNGFASPWQPWGEMVYSFLRARKDPRKLQVIYNTMFGKLWEERGDLEDEDTYLSRREDYGSRDDGSPIELPEGVLVLTCGVDTQDDRLEYEVVGWGHYGESWGIKKGVIMGDPNEPNTWARLDEVIDHLYLFENGRGLKISLTFVDSGGHKTQSVYRNCAMRQGRRVFAIKGKGGSDVPFTKPPSKVGVVANGREVGKVWLYTIGVDAGKADILKGSLKVMEPGPKYCHFPIRAEQGYDLAFFNGLLSERLEVKTEKGRTRYAWVKIPGHERNEALDCRNYAYAALRVLDPDFDAVERKIREANEENPQEKANKKAPAPRTRRRAKNNATSGDDW